MECETEYGPRAYIVSKPFYRPAPSAPSEGQPNTRDGTLEKLHPFRAVPGVCPNAARNPNPVLCVRRNFARLSLSRSRKAFDRRRVCEAVIRAQATFEGDLAAPGRWKQPGCGTRPVWDALQFPGESRQRSALLEAPAFGPARRGWHARDHARRLFASSQGLSAPMKARRQIGARHVAWVRGAFRVGRLRMGQRVGEPANLVADGLTRGTGAQTGGLPRKGRAISGT